MIKRGATVVADILFGAGVLAIGLKFPVYWDRWVYFPSVPNVLDTVFLALAGVYLLTRGGLAWSRTWMPVRKDERAMSPMTATILMVLMTILLAGILYVTVMWLSERGP